MAQNVYIEEGIASYYHDKFVGRKTANGEIFSQQEMTAAHKHLKLGSWVRVTNLSNGKSVELRINDRMPAWNNRSIDLTSKAAMELDYLAKGLTRVRIEVIEGPTPEVPVLPEKLHTELIKTIPMLCCLQCDCLKTQLKPANRVGYLSYEDPPKRFFQRK